MNFEKVRRVLGFVPEFSVQRGIDELLSALKGGAYRDLSNHRNFYGNYEIQYQTSPAPERIGV